MLTGTGALWGFGDETHASSCSVWSGWDIGRGLAFDPTSSSFAPDGVILDGWGGIHPLCDSPAPDLARAPYWLGWDIARDIALLPAMTGGYVLDGWGGIHAFGDQMPPVFHELAELYLTRGAEFNDVLFEGTLTLVHGDCHIGNVLWRDGRPSPQ